MIMTHHSGSNTESSKHQPPSRSEEGEQKLSTEETIKRSTRCDGSGHSVLQNLGQTQSGGDDGNGVGCEEFNCSNTLVRRDTKYTGEQSRFRIEYYVSQTIVKNKNWK